MSPKGAPRDQNDSKMAPQGTKKTAQWPPNASKSTPKAAARHKKTKNTKSKSQLLNKCCFVCRCCRCFCCSWVLLPWGPQPFDTAMQKKGRRGPRSVYNFCRPLGHRGSTPKFHKIQVRFFYRFFDRFCLHFASKMNPKIDKKSINFRIDFCIDFLIDFARSWLPFWLRFGSKN